MRAMSPPHAREFVRVREISLYLAKTLRSRLRRMQTTLSGGLYQRQTSAIY